ncbi:RhoGAP domain-containing protein/PBD domain-containing protein [Cephalotus follicularis]|uniref:RhoGAP domain-containing protein/PBD domain-containing protein n=1 Tax=Cephalotus follicularis TaxID=3775 RepID=A0A1Q3CG27_CEPFO|nr:RhoGAP domain-containing protein/PBD domain-containing protein [Cephalotus follicularis]
MTGLVMVTRGGGCGGGGGGNNKETKGTRSSEEENQLSVLALLVAALRKSMVACRVERGDNDVISTVQHHMEIGWPTNVRHITHVTFDRFNGFLGLPVEFEVEIPGRVPSASASVFGVSAKSMQCSYDSKGNSVPTILLLMQERLYSQDGLKAEGIFRINPENSQEEHVRDQLNRGIVPDNIDVHCLAGLIKAWFRELPSGVLDGLSPEQVLQCNTEEGSVELVKQLKPTETALLNWAVDLMADVVEEEESNKMNARNIAMVFAPNMTQMSDPLTALMHAVQVMNLLKTLIMKTLSEREETATGGCSPMSSHSSHRQTDEDYDSQQEMDTSCELRGPTSDYDDNANYSHSGEVEDEAESLSEIEECFLRQLDENKNAANGIMEHAAGDIQREHVSPRSCSGFNVESGVSVTDSKNENSGSSTSDEEDSGASLIVAEEKDNENILPKECEIANDVEMVDKLVSPSSPLSVLSRESV